MWWNALLPTEKHHHGPGEDRSRCANCAAEQMIREFSEFESFCFVWYGQNVNAFALEAGMVGNRVAGLDLGEPEYSFFLRAMNALYQNRQIVQRERIKNA